ncbi:hypothetical protein ARMA_3053 [Ardenticatena maritima]|uniref:Uncharacterized protein n=1 Tax=Ardenticatena maritima TaxID=872965 RepID=A0A0M9UE42_9CHLR|nr:hypothetical protein ARMA_3053 [Ardenticatena maritima]
MSPWSCRGAPETPTCEQRQAAAHVPPLFVELTAPALFVECARSVLRTYHDKERLMETLIAVILFLIFMLVEGWLSVWFLFRRAE